MLVMMTKAQFLASVEKSLADRRMTATAFGREAVGDPTFVFELRKGRSCGLDVINRVLDFMASPIRTPEAHSEEAA